METWNRTRNRIALFYKIIVALSGNTLMMVAARSIKHPVWGLEVDRRTIHMHTHGGAGKTDESVAQRASINIIRKHNNNLLLVSMNFPLLLEKINWIDLGRETVRGVWWWRRQRHRHRHNDIHIDWILANWLECNFVEMYFIYSNVVPKMMLIMSIKN